MRLALEDSRGIVVVVAERGGGGGSRSYLYLSLDIVDRVAALHLQGDSLASQCLHEDLRYDASEMLRHLPHLYAGRCAAKEIHDQRCTYLHLGNSLLCRLRSETMTVNEYTFFLNRKYKI